LADKLYVIWQNKQVNTNKRKVSLPAQQLQFRVRANISASSFPGFLGLVQSFHFREGCKLSFQN